MRLVAEPPPTGAGTSEPVSHYDQSPRHTTPPPDPLVNPTAPSSPGRKSRRRGNEYHRRRPPTPHPTAYTRGLAEGLSSHCLRPLYPIASSRRRRRSFRCSRQRPPRPSIPAGKRRATLGGVPAGRTSDRQGQKGWFKVGCRARESIHPFLVCARESKIRRVARVMHPSQGRFLSVPCGVNANTEQGVNVTKAGACVATF